MNPSWLTTLVLLLACVTSSLGAKCSDSELKGFGEEYEQCHSKALQKLQADTAAIKSQANPLLDSQQMICGALHTLIEDCTVILGWCYTSTEVEATKQKQKGLMETAMAKLFPTFNVQQCLNLTSSSNSSNNSNSTATTTSSSVNSSTTTTTTVSSSDSTTANINDKYATILNNNNEKIPKVKAGKNGGQSLQPVSLTTLVVVVLLTLVGATAVAPH